MEMPISETLELYGEEIEDTCNPIFVCLKFQRYDFQEERKK